MKSTPSESHSSVSKPNARLSSWATGFSSAGLGRLHGRDPAENRKSLFSYCVKDASGRIHDEGKIGATRNDLDSWMKILPQPWTVAMEATIFTGWIYDHLLPHAEGV